MGLSDQERIQKMYPAIMQMTKSGDSLEKHPKLKELCGKLWPAFLGKNPNNLHWLLGSSATKLITKPGSAWETAILEHLESTQEDKDCFRDENEHEKMFDYNLSIEKLLHSEQAKVYRIFAYSESLTYPLRRYNDKFEESFSALSDLISAIQGECYTIFANDDTFAKAYILNRICDFLYENYFPYWKEKWDFFTKLLVVHNCHHHLKRPMECTIIDGEELKTITNWHTVLAVSKERSTKEEYLLNRIVIAIRIMGYEITEHFMEDLIENIKKAKLSPNEIKIIKKECTKALKSSADKKEKEREIPEWEKFEGICYYDVGREYKEVVEKWNSSLKENKKKENEDGEANKYCSANS